MGVPSRRRCRTAWEHLDLGDHRAPPEAPSSSTEGSEKVAELGAAGGWFTLQLAERVGPNGRVYAEDIQPRVLEGIRRRMQSENITLRDDGARHGERSASAGGARCGAYLRRIS